jgi:phage-related tail fiber protein
VNAGDAVTKSYADALTSSLDIKASVKAATTGNITLSGTQTIDGVVLAAGQRVLVKDQTNATQNGIYEVAASTWSRATDADSSDEVTPGLFCFVEQGTTNADSGWVLISDGTITLGSSNIAFSQFSKTAEITAGDGLTRVGSTISAVGTASRVTVSGAGIDIASTYVGQATITTLGTITTGTWSGTAIGLTKGGTGADLSALSSGTLIKKAAGATLTSAVVDTDYLSPSSIIDGGTF